jgi:hypothetical protein
VEVASIKIGAAGAIGAILARNPVTWGATAVWDTQYKAFIPKIEETEGPEKIGHPEKTTACIMVRITVKICTFKVQGKSK